MSAPASSLSSRAPWRTAGGAVVSLGQADGVVWAGTKPDSLPELPRSVRWVQLPSAGVEPWMERISATPQVTFTSAAGAYAPQVAEHALALLLSGVRGIAASARRRTWEIPSHDTLTGTTVAIIGAGGIGRALIAQLAPHAVEAIAVTLQRPRRAGRRAHAAGRPDRRGVERSRPLRHRRAGHQRHAPPGRRGRARADALARLDRQRRPRLADRHRRAGRGAARASGSAARRST